LKSLPTHCPSCGEGLLTKRLLCPKCETEVEGAYPLPALVRLSGDDQAFVLSFVKASGSLKQMAALLGVSYPTVRNRLDDIINTLERIEGEREGSDE